MAADSPDTPLLNAHRVDSLPRYDSDVFPPPYSRQATDLRESAAYVVFPFSPPPSPSPPTREYYTETIYTCKHAVCEMEMLPIPENMAGMRTNAPGWLFEGNVENPRRMFSNHPCSICVEMDQERRGVLSEIKTACILVIAAMLLFASTVLLLLIAFFV